MEGIAIVECILVGNLDLGLSSLADLQGFAMAAFCLKMETNLYKFI